MAKFQISMFLCALIVLVHVVPHSGNHTPPPIFILGDSTADVGTNTYLPESVVQVRANFSPYGIDFPHKRPTGRFSNGFNTADYIARYFGLVRSPPPFLFLLTLEPPRFHSHLLKGANFASGGAGLLDITSEKLNVVPLSQQISQFSTVKDNLTALIGASATKKTLSQSFFFISIGSNDIMGYFLTNSTIQKDDFIAGLMLEYANHITNLYDIGARKFGITSVAPVGCCPSQRLVQKVLNGTDGCFEAENDFALAFHSALDSLLESFSSQLPGFKYSLGNGYKMAIDVINNPGASGFENVDSACCGNGFFNAQVSCNPTASVCEDRHKYLFWDQFHPTKKAAFLAARTLYYGPPSYVSPINFSELKKY